MIVSVYIQHLSNCCVFTGPVTPLDFSELSTTVTSSGMKSDQPAKLAIDRTVSSCSSLYGIGKTWLRVDVRTVRYIRMVRLLFPEDSEIRTTIFIGRSLHSNGSNGNIQCDKGRRASMKSWVIFTCGPPILGQYIYIERQTSSMNVCEIQVFYGKITLWILHCFSANSSCSIFQILFWISTVV